MSWISIIEEIKALKNAYLLRRPLLLFLIFYAGGLVGLKHGGILDRTNPQDVSRWAGQRVRVTGIVTDPPEINPRGVQFIMRAETLRSSTQTISASGKILVELFGKAVDFALPGDRVSIWGTLNRPTEARIPGTFNYADFLSNKGIYSQMFTSEYTAENLGDAGTLRLKRLGCRIQSHLTTVFLRHLPAEQAAVLAGLVVGNRPRFHPEIKRIFTESGTMHILVASGSNVAFVVGLWYLLTRLLLRFSRRWTLASAVPMVWIYVLVTGADPPILRAGIMTTIGIGAILFSREDRPYQALGLAALGIILPSPKSLFDVGFQMSFLTVFGLLFYLPKCDPLWNKNNVLIRNFCRLVSTSWVAQFWILPITLGVFKRFFPVSLLSNIFIVPLAGAGLAAGFLLGAIDYLNFHFCSIRWILAAVNFLISFYLKILIDLTRFFADHPGKSYWISSPGTLWVTGFYLSALLIFFIRRSILARWGFGMALLLMTGGWWIHWQERKTPPDLQITWLDMGRTLTALIETPEGKKILINPGPRSPVDTLERSLMPYLTERGIHRVDSVIYPGPLPPDAQNANGLNKWLTIKEVIILSTSPVSCGSLTIQPLPGSRTGSAHIPIYLTKGPDQVVLGKTIGLKAQDWLLNSKVKNISLIQARFSDKAQWREAFVQKFKPRILVETGYNSERYPSCAPWKNLPLVVPQKSGIFIWNSAWGPARVQPHRTH